MTRTYHGLTDADLRFIGWLAGVQLVQIIAAKKQVAA
jgi:hypothetical protein